MNGTSDRERVEAEARDAADSAGMETGISGVPIHAYATGFIAGRTVTAEQVEAAAKAYHSADVPNDPASWELDLLADDYRDCTRAAFRAAGLLIEGEDDE